MNRPYLLAAGFDFTVSGKPVSTFCEPCAFRDLTSVLVLNAVYASHLTSML